MDIVGRRNWYFLLSLAIILPGIISMLFFGFRLGIDFAGGDQFNIAFTKLPSMWRPPYSRLVRTTS